MDRCLGVPPPPELSEPNMPACSTPEHRTHTDRKKEEEIIIKSKSNNVTKNVTGRSNEQNNVETDKLGTVSQ